MKVAATEVKTGKSTFPFSLFQAKQFNGWWDRVINCLLEILNVIYSYVQEIGLKIFQLSNFMKENEILLIVFSNDESAKRTM